jgi:hypothetical protein
MSVQVTMPEKSENGLQKIGQIFQMGMQAKGALSGKGKAAPMVETDAMQRRMNTLKKQRDAGEQGPTPY